MAYDEIAKGEQETRNLLVRFEQDYPGAAKRDNVDEIARTLQRKESRVSVLTKLQEKKEEARQKGTNLPSKKEE